MKELFAKKAISSELMDERNRHLLNALLDNLVKNQLKSVDFDILTKGNRDLAHEVRNLALACSDDLKDQRSPQGLLLQLILESNYALHVHKKNNIIIARTMELLKEAYVHIERMRGKEVVLFMGNTGSGKSAAIEFFLGTEISETIYMQGFEMPKKDHLGKDLPHADYMLGDCPSFNDTRGVDYELCTNLSIDETVKHSKNIRSIVVVVPASAFLIDRGNNVIELVSRVQDRFPDTFKVNTAVSNPRIFLLVTKSNGIQREAVKKLVDGTQINELVKETQTELKELSEKGADMDSFKIHAIKRRLDIWRTIQLLQTQQIHFIDTQNKMQRRELLAEYSQKRTDQKGSYQKAMAEDYMQHKFGDYVQMAAHSWNRLILDKYLEVLPKLIEMTKLELVRKTQILSELNTNKNQKDEHGKKFAINEAIQIETANLESLQKKMRDLAIIIAT